MTTIIGLLAAFCTTISYFPQLKKCIDTGSAGDLSLKMFSVSASALLCGQFMAFYKEMPLSLSPMP
jgi:uncharacterized protein with PQ loop repeat